MRLALVYTEEEPPRDVLEMLATDAVPVALAASSRQEDWIGRVTAVERRWRIEAADLAVDRRLGKSGIRLHSLSEQLAGLCTRLRLQGIHAWGVAAAAVSAAAAVRARLPLLFSFAPGEPGTQPGWSGPAMRAVVQAARAVSVFSREDERTVRQSLDPAGPVVVIPPVIGPAGAAETVALDVEGPILGTFGDLSRDSGLDIVLEALARLAGRHRPWLLLGGVVRPREAFYLAPLLDRHPFAFRFLRLGEVSPAKRRALMGACTALLFPLASAAQAWLVLEAMASGRPVLSAPVGAVADSATDGESARLLPPWDPRAWAAAIDTLLDDPAAARALGEAGARAVRPLLDGQQARARWNDFCRYALEAARPDDAPDGRLQRPEGGCAPCT
ncbi:MAG: glycosyltransferase family 4 protein [Candidatus Riflebacteria bacterium]|nr:glycosyltransferase family 4 protein [Candidatus Riflebacteria bacterium]